MAEIDKQSIPQTRMADARIERVICRRDRPVGSVSLTQAVSVTGNRVGATLFGDAGRDAVGH